LISFFLNAYIPKVLFDCRELLKGLFEVVGRGEVERDKVLVTADDAQKVKLEAEQDLGVVERDLSDVVLDLCACALR